MNLFHLLFMDSSADFEKKIFFLPLTQGNIFILPKDSRVIT